MRVWMQAALIWMATSGAVMADCVVMVHGLARSSTSFLVMENLLHAVGYDVVTVDYPSTSGTIEVLADDAMPRAIGKCAKDDEIHFVTHSMGGILVRYYFKDKAKRPENLGRVVMLAPPNKGSYLVNELVDLPGFDLWNGDAGAQLIAKPDGLPNTLGPVDYPVGVIAGSQSISPVFSALIPGDDDGKVSIESTKLDGMADHIILPVTHTFIMNNPDVLRQVAHFLREGRFKEEKSDLRDD